MRRRRAIKKQASAETKARNLLARGFCPVCEMLLSSKYHTGCVYEHTQEGGDLTETNHTVSKA